MRLLGLVFNRESSYLLEQEAGVDQALIEKWQDEIAALETGQSHGNAVATGSAS